MIILITGGLGFIGSHLCERLLEEGHAVIALDNLFTGSEYNVEHLASNPNFRFIRHDIIDPIVIETTKLDQIYNLACPASPVHYQANPVRTIKANTIGVINVLGLAKQHGARILQASTSEVYGDPLEHPQKETYRCNVNTTGPRACYDEGKRVAETLCFDYHRQHGMEIRVARIFNTYGPRMAADDGRVVSNFSIQALRGSPLTIYGDGSQTRAFCFVSDMVDGLVRLMDQNAIIGPVNLGNPNEVTISEIAKKILELTGSKSSITHAPLPQDDPRQRCPDISLAKKELGWEPRVALDDGLQKVIHFFSLQKNIYELK